MTSIKKWRSYVRILKIRQPKTKEQKIPRKRRTVNNFPMPHYLNGNQKSVDRSFITTIAEYLSMGLIAKKAFSTTTGTQPKTKLSLPHINALGQNKEKKKIEISKKYFFTFKILAYLTIESSKIKLSHYTDLIEYYIGELEKYCMYKWDQAELFMEIIKQRVFMKFLNEKVLKREDLAI